VEYRSSIRSVVPAALVAAALVQGAATDFVELDVVALDRQGNRVTYLQPDRGARPSAPTGNTRS